jgi:hypothetical protein
MSKDGDWILREDSEAIAHVLGVLARRGAYYRFGAPLDLRWLAGGWSAHFAFQQEALRVRTDFVTRPPRVSTEQLAQMWREADSTGCQVVPLERLAAIKLTHREKDYAVVGEVARRLGDIRAQLRHSRSSRDLMELARHYPSELQEIARERPLLGNVAKGRDDLEAALDRERRQLMRADEQRLARYQEAASEWASMWQRYNNRDMAEMTLEQAHPLLVSLAEQALPYEP